LGGGIVHAGMKISGNHEQGTGSGSCSWNYSSEQPILASNTRI